MSYILDALRRADAERERGGVPGLHTQTMTEAGDDAEATPTPRGLKPWHWVAIGLAGGLAVAIAWTWRGEEPPPLAARPPPPPMPIEQSTPPVAVAPPPLATPEPTPSTPVAIAPMRASPPPPPPPPPSPPAATRPATAAPAASAAIAAAAPAAAASTPRVASLAELPPELRSGLPALAFGGSIYSNTPGNRLLIVNGQLMHEGESLGPGVVLEQIKPKAAVLVIRGQRIEVGL